MVGQATRFAKLGSRGRVVSHDIANIVESIEHTYALYAGPIAQYVVPVAYQHWSTAHQPRLATLIKYVNRLAETLPHPADNEGFTVAASSTILAQGNHGEN